MNILTPEQLPEFIERFGACGDGLLQHFAYSFPNYHGPPEATMLMTIRDSSKPGDHWANVRVVVLEATHVCCIDQRGLNQVFFWDLHIGYFDGTFYLDFGDLQDYPETLEEYRESKMLIAGRTVMWEALPVNQNRSIA